MSQEANEQHTTEQEMREAMVPWHDTENELVEYIRSLVDRPHDYGTCVYAMSMAATAAFQYVARKLGTTGFQAGCADLDIVRRTRRIKGPFLLLKAEDLLYPQYDLDEKLAELKEKSADWLREQAQKKLAENDQGHVHRNVWLHWQELAGKGAGAAG